MSASAVTVAPYVRTTYSAGRLSIALWDHWVPGANQYSRYIIQEWGKRNNVEVQIDYITSIGYKDALIALAEAKSKAGHDV
jgi:hypothetical protein